MLHTIVENQELKTQNKSAATVFPPSLSSLSSLLNALNQSSLACLKIGLAEIVNIAGHDLEHQHQRDLTEVTVMAMRNRPEHVADILLVSSWMLTEALCTDAQRDVVKQHWLAIAQATEDALEGLNAT